jgi:hypothetical protein
MILHTYYYAPSSEHPSLFVHGCELLYQKVMGGPISDDDVGVWSGRCGIISYSVTCHNGRYSGRVGIRSSQADYCNNIGEFVYNLDEGEQIESAQQCANVLARESKWLLLVIAGWLESSEAKRILGTI